MAARPITLHVGVESHAPYQIRSSGICVCTGTGSRFWYKSINVQSAETVRSIVEIATGDKLSLEETNELLHKYHQALLYSAGKLDRLTLITMYMYQVNSDGVLHCTIKLKIADL